MEMKWLRSQFATVWEGRRLVVSQHATPGIRRQGDLLGLHSSSLYCQVAPESALNLHFMRLIDGEFLGTSFCVWPKMAAYLRQLGYAINGKRVRRLMDILAIHPRRISVSPGMGH